MSSRAGTIQTIAGNGTFGYSGDGAAAIVAEFQPSYGVTIDNQGNLYVADSDNNVIRKISVSGAITTIACDGTAAPAATVD